MKKFSTSKPLRSPLSYLLVVALLGPVYPLHAGGGDGGKAAHSAPRITHTVRKSSMSAKFLAEVSALYDSIDLQEAGLTKKAFSYALRGYYYLLNHHYLSRPGILSICDLSQSSRNKRFYVVDLDQKTLLVNTYVAHGHNSGGEFAHTFSNNPASHKSSLGFYITEDTYYGENGLSLKIHGLEKGINDKASRRNIVIHGSEYVGEDYLRMNQFSGRSYGCPALPAADAETVIDDIKEGSCLFIYHPTQKYISRSKILND